MPIPDSAVFADDWVRAWNEHDVEAVLVHFHDDVVFSSPVAARMFPETGGVVRGVCAGDQLPQRARRTGERGAALRR
jgi:hypothetical protein